MSNPDRLQREATEHAEVLIEDRGPVNALSWANHCMIRDTGGFWRRVHDEIVRQIRASNAKAELDRLQDDESALTLIEDRGLSNALAWAIHCANRSTDGFWSRVVQYIEMIRDEEDESESDEAADKGDWQFHQEHDQ